MRRRTAVLGAIGLAVAGCSIGPAPAPPVAVYDLGLEAPKPASAVQLNSSLAIDEVSAAPWLHSTAILYRLAYRDAARVHPYSRARWAAAPSTLVNQRLRVAFGQSAKSGVAAAFDGVNTEFLLRVELDGFVQVVDSPSAARGLVRARASLINTAQRMLRAQRSFEVEYPSPSVDAPGAVRALSAATDALIVRLIEWAAQQTGAR
jgi:cholesterol transport system auxiliary component